MLLIRMRFDRSGRCGWRPELEDEIGCPWGHFERWDGTSAVPGNRFLFFAPVELKEGSTAELARQGPAKSRRVAGWAGEFAGDRLTF